MRTTKLNRVLSMLLVLVMIMTLLPTAAFAADTDTVSATKVTVSTPADITAGQYLIYGESSQAISGKDAGAFMSTNGSSATRLMSADLSITAGTVETGDKNCIWNLISTENGFYVQNEQTKEYLYYDSAKGGNIISKTSDVSSAGVWTVVQNGDAWTLQEAASGRQLSCNRFGSSPNYYYGFAAYANNSSTKRSLEFYKVADDPYSGIDKKLSVYEKVDSISAGDTVVIYNAGNSMAVTSEVLSTYYLTPLGITPDAELGVLASDSKVIAWDVNVDENGLYTFKQGDTALQMGTNNNKFNLSGVGTATDKWHLDPSGITDGVYYMYGDGMNGKYDHVYMEYFLYTKKDESGNIISSTPEFSAYDTGAAKLNESAFGMTFYKLVRQGVDDTPEDNGLPKEGDQFVIYNQSSKGVLAGQNDAFCAGNTPAEIVDGKAVPSNGAVVFTIEKNGEYYRFKNETYGYLCSNGSGKNAFYSKDFTGSVNDVEVKAEDADWLVRTCSGGVGGYEMESRSAKYSGHSQWLEYYSDCYQTYSMYKVEDYTIYSFFFYPVADNVNVKDGIVIRPTITIPENLPAAYLGDDYEFDITFSSILGIDDPWTEYSIKDVNGSYIPDTQISPMLTILQGNTDVEVLDAYEKGDGRAHITVWSSDIEKAYETGDSFTITFAFKDPDGNEARASAVIKIVDEPIISNLTPAQGSETLTDKQPTISADIANAGENPTVEMTVNGEKVNAVYENGKVSYTPAEAMEDGKVTVNVKVTRADGKTGEKTWSFTVGEAQYQLYFGQLHSHTGEYSDGAGTLESALSYVKNLPDSANVDFVAFTDHSNYFDGSKVGGSANPEAALYDMTQASAASQALWAGYKEKVAKFNAEQSDIVAIAGFEMTWSGGPGHINTFNTPGIVSRNNATLNNKTSDAGMKAYYKLLSDEKGADSVSQFNHPGTTFGNFSDFSYYDAVIDSRIFLVEVGNGEGQIGAGGYYPSYEQYIMALDKGWHVAPSNNQDNHKGKWGNANDARDVILTDNFTEDGIYQALREMRVYSTEDKNLEISYTLNGEQLGSIISEIPEKATINVSVHDPDKTDSIRKVEVVVNNGKTAYTWDDAAELAKGELTAELDAKYNYYFIRVTEADGDLAVTAPVWIGDILRLGISDAKSETALPVTGEELTITTTFFNSEAEDAKITSLTYSVDGEEFSGETPIDLPKSSTKDVSFKYTPKAARLTTVKISAVVDFKGEAYTFTKDVALDVLDADALVYIGIDASHYNEYVAGNYKDSMGNFSNLAAGYSVRTVMLGTSEDLIAACSNEKYKALILTSPTRRDGTALKDPYANYSDAEIAAIAEFNANGGTVVVAGWSDQYESYGTLPEGEHMSDQQNKLLKALGSSLRIGDDTAYDDVNGAANDTKYGKWRLYPSNYNLSNMLMEGVEYDPANPTDNKYTQLFSQYGGATIYAVDSSGNATTTLPDTVSPAVYGFTTTVSKDMDNDQRGGTSYTYGLTNGEKAVMLLATEQLDGKGLIVVSGAAFMSNFEVQAQNTDSGAEKNYSNYTICENLANYINPIKVTPIADVQAEKEEGIKYTIEGVVTSNASGYDADTAFFDCIYVQDETGGINAFPVAGNYKIGDKVRITGTTSSYQGERQIAVLTCTKLVGTGAVEPTVVTSAQINDGSVLGKLIKISGTVTKIEMAEGLVQTILVKDKAGNVSRLFIDGYITKDKSISGLSVGATITAVGLASYDNTCVLADVTEMSAIVRIRDRADIVCGGCGMPFTDVPEDEWYHDYIKTVWENGLMVGTEAALFEPETNMDRAMLATVLYRMADSPDVTSMDNPFTDIEGHWAHNAIVWAYNAGVTNGTTATTFSPDDFITRQEVVTMLYRYAGSPKVSGTLSFKDINDIDDWALDAVVWANQNKIVEGHDTGYFKPLDNATRAELAKILAVYISK